MRTFLFYVLFFSCHLAMGQKSNTIKSKIEFYDFVTFDVISVIKWDKEFRRKDIVPLNFSNKERIGTIILIGSIYKDTTFSYSTKNMKDTIIDIFKNPVRYIESQKTKDTVNFFNEEFFNSMKSFSLDSMKPYFSDSNSWNSFIYHRPIIFNDGVFFFSKYNKKYIFQIQHYSCKMIKINNYKYFEYKNIDGYWQQNNSRNITANIFYSYKSVSNLMYLYHFDYKIKGKYYGTAFLKPGRKLILKLSR